MGAYKDKCDADKLKGFRKLYEKAANFYGQIAATAFRGNI